MDLQEKDGFREQSPTKLAQERIGSATKRGPQNERDEERPWRAEGALARCGRREGGATSN